MRASMLLFVLTYLGIRFDLNLIGLPSGSRSRLVGTLIAARPMPVWISHSERYPFFVILRFPSLHPNCTYIQRKSSISTFTASARSFRALSGRISVRESSKNDSGFLCPVNSTILDSTI
jgi:hypothetical protein